MKFQVLVSTLNNDDCFKLVKKMNISSDAIVINQCNKNSIEKYKKSNYCINIINTQEKGLSLSRNMALKNANAEICILADDDVEYLPNYKEKIIEQFAKNPNADIIAFQVEGIEKEYKKYYKKKRSLNYLTIMKVSSVEIAFRVKSIRGKIDFNDLFGAGAKYSLGEENIFLMECLKKKVKIIYVPLKIAKLHLGNSTWFTGYNEYYFFSKGAAFAAMSKKISVLLILQFAVRKYSLYNEKITFFKAVKNMIKGRNNYISLKKCQYLKE